VLVATAGSYTFQSNSAINLYGYLYNNSFNATNPSANLIASDGNSARNLQFQLTVSLQPNVVYVLVVTTYNANVTGSFTITASGVENIIFVPPVTTTETVTVTTTPGQFV
jgi:hypothetical protein